MPDTPPTRRAARSARPLRPGEYSRAHLLRAVLAVGVLAPARAWAEIADKMPSASQEWMSLLIVGALNHALSLLRWWAPLLLVPLCAGNLAVVLADATQEPMRSLIVRELGEGYSARATALAVCLLIVPCAVAALRRSRSKRTK